MKRALVMLALAGCTSSQLLPPVLRTRVGPASSRPVSRMVAVPATCGVFGHELPTQGNTVGVPSKCPEHAAAGADSIIRSALEFRGFRVFDSEEVNAVTATRHETRIREAKVDPRTGVADSSNTAILTEIVGARFEDATPTEQAAILADLRADSVLSARIWISAPIGMSARRTVMVQVQLATASDRVLVWARRCEIEVAGMPSDMEAIERTTRCVMEGAR